MSIDKKLAIRTAVARVADLASVALKCEESGDITPLYDHMIGLLNAQRYNCDACPNAVINEMAEAFHRAKAYPFKETTRCSILSGFNEQDWDKVIQGDAELPRLFQDRSDKF